MNILLNLVVGILMIAGTGVVLAWCFQKIKNLMGITKPKSDE